VKPISAERLTASKDNHFMIGDDALTMAEQLDKRNADGLLKRAGGC
jgi:hypothetical protein